MSWPSRGSRRRRERGFGIGSVLGSIFKAQVETKNGAIRTCPNGYILSDKGWTNAGGVFLAPRTTADGRMASLRGGLRSATNCPKPPGDFPVFVDDRGTHNWIPMKDCRKCPNHIPRTRGARYPCCAVLRAMASAEPSPAAKVKDVLQVAMERVREVLG